MIDLHYWPTSNGKKIGIMLEECGLEYRTHAVNISRGDQHQPEFLALNPNGKIPAIVDQDAEGGPMTVFESGAILEYLAEKTGRFLPTDRRGKYRVLQWLHWQMGGLGPNAGQVHHFNRSAPEPVPYAIERFGKETRRLYGILDQQLSARAHIAGDDYSIADIASWPWIGRYEWQRINLGEFPNVKRWFEAVGSRPAVKRAMELGQAIIDGR